MNPLTKHFRQPSIYIQLPSKGVFYEENSFKKTENNEYPVLPMTAMDEIAYRTPDALFNGTATVSVIESCFPSIKNGWNTASCDFSSILVAIRIASYGHMMDIDTDCPHCKTENSYELDLRGIIDQVSTPDYSKPVELGDIAVFFKPLTYKQIYDTQMEQFEEEQKLISFAKLSESENSDKRMEFLQNCLKNMSNLSINVIANSIAFIKTEDTVVTDENHIKEYITNCDRDSFTKIKDQLQKLKESSEFKPLDIQCQNPECAKEYTVPFTLDSSNFFG